jgi:hypothetical protein
MLKGYSEWMNPYPPTQQENVDVQHLKLLAIFHYIVAGVAALFACFPLIHLVMGLFMVFAPDSFGSSRDQPPAFLGWFFVVFALVIILAGWAFAVLVLTAGRCIARRKLYTFCFVMACVECIFMPFGTVLGVFTIIVLNRASVKNLFVPRPSW